MWFVFSLGGISTISPFVDNAVRSLKSKETLEVKIGGLSRSDCYKRKGRMSTHRIKGKRLKAIWQTEPRPAVNKFNWVLVAGVCGSGLSNTVTLRPGLKA